MGSKAPGNGNSAISDDLRAKVVRLYEPEPVSQDNWLGLGVLVVVGLLGMASLLYWLS